MNILIAGIHGVGKTFLASKVPLQLELMHTSASRIIKDEIANADWGVEKQVRNINANQLALIVGVKRLNAAGQKLLLDGHFVLLDVKGDFVRLEAEVFQDLALKAVILIEAKAGIVAERIKQRDSRVLSAEFLDEFAKAERENAQEICKHLKVPLHILQEPTTQEFNVTLTSLSRNGNVTLNL